MLLNYCTTLQYCTVPYSTHSLSNLLILQSEDLPSVLLLTPATLAFAWWQEWSSDLDTHKGLAMRHQSTSVPTKMNSAE
jgi:hypothetical protein